jgi:putative oxidoreductase
MMVGTGLHPPDMWALAAGSSEFGGGMLTALGLLWPVGPITIMAPMGVAIGKVHWGKPIWTGKGGAELPVTNTAAALALASSGPGRFSLDNLLGIRLPRPAAVLVAAGTAVGLGVAFYSTRRRERQGSEAPSPEQAAESVATGSEAL